MQISARRTVLAAIAIVGLVACGGSDDKATPDERMIEEAIENAGGGSVDIESGDDGELTIESEDGSITVQSNGSLPSGFPAAVPVPSNWNIVSSSDMSASGVSAWTIYCEQDVDSATATTEMRALMSAAGFTEISTMNSSGGSVTVWESDLYIVQAIIAPAAEGGGSNVGLTVTTKTE